MNGSTHAKPGKIAIENMSSHLELSRMFKMMDQFPVSCNCSNYGMETNFERGGHYDLWKIDNGRYQKESLDFLKKWIRPACSS